MKRRKMKRKNMNKEGSVETVLDCVVPYIHDGDDLNSISLLSRKFYQLDCITRKHLTVHLHYAPNPSTLSKRFPFIESLTLKGPPTCDFPQISATPWIKEISVKFECLKALHIRRMLVCDEDLALLAKTRGKDLRSLKICVCEGYSEDGLVYISEYCNDLRSLCLEYGFTDGEMTGEWLRELALRNTPIESLHFRYLYNDIDDFDVEDLTLVAQRCSNSLVSLKITYKPLNLLGDAFSHAIKLQDFDGAFYVKDGDYTSFKFPPSICRLGIEDLPVTSLSLLLPYVNQLRELNLTCIHIEEYCVCFLNERCPNLEVLVTPDICGDMGLRVIGQVCKKLLKLIYCGHVTHMGLIALVQGCTNLEYLHVTLSNISNEAIECVGTHLKNLHDFRMELLKKAGISMTDLPLDNGIRAMLKGCIKLKRLALKLCDKGLTDVGLGYIGKYGHNLTSLFLKCTGESDAGLLELSKGCPKLRKLNLWDCPFSEQAIATFVFNIHSLRYVWVENGCCTVLALTRPTFTAEVLRELTPYVTLAEKLHKLALQLVADGSGLGSVKITYTSSRATDDFDTPLVDAMVAKGICIDGSSDKPLEIIKVEIADVESRLAGEIKVEGRVKDGVPHLTKVGALDVDVSLEGNILLCRQAPHQPNVITSVSSILDDEENVNITSMSFGWIAQRKQALMVIGVDEKPSKKALKKIDELPAVDELVFLAF